MDDHPAHAMPDSTTTYHLIEKRQSGTESFELKVPMILQTGTEVLIASQSGIKIEVLEESRCCCYVCTHKEPALPHCLVSSSKPIRILTEDETRISPVESLGMDFAQGWNKLTDELRIKILGYNLTQQCIITQREPEKIDPRGFTTDCILHHHIAFGPVFATLATRVFYETNTIRLDHARLPPRATRRYIKRVFVPVTVPSTSSWRTLKTLSVAAAAASGFAGVRYVTIEFDMEAIAEEFAENTDHYMHMSHISLGCKGSLSFEYRGSRRSSEMRQYEQFARELIAFTE
ncbi:uncharacterized protein EKO05_0003232 [Ascochyta rabiei]|uniref:uncharacterized protein n=1 Tax=Didymella rabiei TaxID=5454 RepID=UPI00190274E5|nr:uncharacterized protein EKO05_0003232 [Ascochyta rabiei]UPX12693.1 hypothetical protein EKO05_0003232 [Ascochyta rabiei]